MDRALFIDLLNKGAGVDTIIQDYCIEKGKDPKMVQYLLDACTMHPLLFNQCAAHAISYYKRKFEVTSVVCNNIIIFYY